MAPVVASRVRPEVELNVPPVVPVIVGVGFVPLAQYDVAPYANAAEVAGFTVTVVAADVVVQPAELVTVTV
jgi:hypothetical protein